MFADCWFHQCFSLRFALPSIIQLFTPFPKLDAFALFERLAQFQKSSVRSFIKMMERPRVYHGQVVSVRSLFADGIQLASDLATVTAMPEKSAQKQAVRSIIQPYLQLVPPEARCVHTGLRLTDIWRYMRYSWVIPYNSTPGRICSISSGMQHVLFIQ